MPLLDITNPRVINFLIKNYEKENRLRLKWLEKNQEQIQKAATLSRESNDLFESDVIAYKMSEGMSTLTRDHINAGKNRRQKPINDVKNIPGISRLRHDHSIVDVGLGDPEVDIRLKRPDSDTSVDPIMRPVDPKVSEIIYKSKPEFGREKYLKQRAKKIPENKYYFAESSNYDYGWRFSESELRPKATYGRCWHLAKAIRSRVGPQPDPHHYKPSETSGLTKCTGI